jgi:hypothetical protein
MMEVMMMLMMVMVRLMMMMSAVWMQMHEQRHENSLHKRRAFAS